MGSRTLRLVGMAVAAVSLALPAAASADPTATTLSCQPSPVALGSASSCTASVDPGFPTGSVSFSATGPGGAFSSSSCTLAALTGRSLCKVTFTPSALGSHALLAEYQGNPGFDPSAGGTTLQAVPAPAPQKAKKCKKGQKRKQGKCVKKKRKKKKK